MREALQSWFAGLELRERRVLVGGAILVAVLILVGGLLLPMNAAVTAAMRQSKQRRADLAWMRANAPEIRAGAARVRVPSNEPALVLIDRTAQDAGLAAALRGTQPSGTGEVRVQLQAAPFDALMLWLATLDQRYGLSVESIDVDRGTRTGTVDANVIFARADGA